MLKIQLRIIAGICSIFILFLGGSTDNRSTGRIKETYIEILQNNTNYFHMDTVCNELVDTDNTGFNGTYMYLNEHFSEAGGHIYQVEPVRFTVLDMDGDSIPEVVLEVSAPFGDKIFLHCENDMVYGYWFSYRGMNGLKKDGTFEWTGNISYSGVSKLRFKSGGVFEKEELCKLDYPFYYIDNEGVSKDSFDSFYDLQEQKEGVEWYEFNEETIARDFAAAWESLLR